MIGPAGAKATAKAKGRAQRGPSLSGREALVTSQSAARHFHLFVRNRDVLNGLVGVGFRQTGQPMEKVMQILAMNGRWIVR